MPETTAVAWAEALDRVLSRYQKNAESVLQVCIDLQEEVHFVPPEAQVAIGRALGVTALRVRGVVSFYSFLSDTWLGEYVVYLSDNVTDQMLGSRALAQRLCGRLGVEMGKVRGDGRVSVHLTSCTGLGDQGPAALVNGQAVTRLGPERVDQIAELIEARRPLVQWPREFFRVVANIRRSDGVFRKPVPPGEGIKACLGRGAQVTMPHTEELNPEDAGEGRLDRVSEEILKQIQASGLRGRGGAGFKTAIKLDTVRAQKGRDRYVVCNADEGEPGTFKDRVLLMEYPDLVFEGMTIAALGVKATEGVIYVRGEYRFMKDHLEGVLSRRRELRLLGKDILGSGFDFDVRIHWGAGAYICGMETAMCKSIEGRRGIPRRRWPLPVHQGFRKRPTLINNVETFAALATIGLNGGKWFARYGTEQSSGTKWFSVSGDVDQPGVYEYPHGVSLREVLRDSGARDAQAVMVSGASGTLVAEADFDRALAFEDLAGVGTLMVFGRERDLFDVAWNFAHFFQHESCGLCTPCRVGTTLLVSILEKFKRGWGTQLDLEDVKLLATTMKLGAHCGLGQTAPNHLVDAIKSFPHVFEGRMQTRDFTPAFDLNGALEEARQLAGRTDAAAFVPVH